jgi:hypothetical protein
LESHFRKAKVAIPAEGLRRLLRVKELAREHMPAAINALVSIMNNPKASDAARVSAATALLDRGYGKPQQHIEAQIGSYVAWLPTPYDTAEEWAAAVKAEMALQQRPKLEGGAPNHNHLLEAREADGNNEG